MKTLPQQTINIVIDGKRFTDVPMVTADQVKKHKMEYVSTNTNLGFTIYQIAGSYFVYAHQ